MEFKGSLLISILCFSALFLPTITLAGPLDKIECLATKVGMLSTHPIIQQQAKLYRDNDLKTPQIAVSERTDKRWQDEAVDSQWLSAIINNPASTPIRKFIEKYSLIGEGFLIGIDGGLIAATNKTSDYWQGDESQFTETLNMLSGETFILGPIADKSSHSMLIKIASPVIDKQAKFNGVLVIGLDAFVLDIHQVCQP